MKRRNLPTFSTTWPEICIFWKWYLEKLFLEVTSVREGRQAGRMSYKQHEMRDDCSFKSNPKAPPTPFGPVDKTEVSLKFKISLKHHQKDVFLVHFKILFSESTTLIARSSQDGWSHSRSDLSFKTLKKGKLFCRLHSFQQRKEEAEKEKWKNPRPHDRENVQIEVKRMTNGGA